MKNKDFKIFLEALDELEREKGIEKEKVLETVEAALLAAYKKNYGDEQNAKVEINENTGEVKIFTIKEVCEEVYDPGCEISLEDAAKYMKKPNYGDFVNVEENSDEFRRNAIQNAKQIVIQRIREAEREIVFQKFKDKQDTIVIGVVRRIDEKGNIYIDFSGIESVLPVTEQSPVDVYKLGSRLKVYIVEVAKSTKFPKILISRKNEGFLKKLFEFEIPEIEDGLIEIKSVSREAGSRAKVAVYSSNPDIDTVGACIGQKGTRIKAIVEELNGEKIDIVDWSEDKATFVANALSPAKVRTVELLDGGFTSRVIVPNDQLSLAIGKNGQNARLAAKLTNMKIDIKVDGAVLSKPVVEDDEEDEE